MSLRRRISALFLLGALASACAPDLVLSEEVDVACRSDKACTRGTVCHPLLFRCLPAAAIDRSAPEILSVSAASETTVDVFFGEVMSAGVLDRDAYAIVDPFGQTLAVVDVRADDGEAPQHVTLVTGAQVPGALYTLTAHGLADLQLNPLPEPASKAFVGFGVPDTTPPELLGVAALTSATVSVTFSEPMARLQVVDPAAYALERLGGSPVAIAQLLTENDQNVTLVTEPLQPGRAYVLSLSAIADLAGNPLPEAERSQVFLGFGEPDVTPPEPLWPQANLEVDPAGLLFIWTARAGAEGYTLQVDDDAAFAEPVLHQVEVNAQDGANLTLTAAEAPALFQPITYWWRVRADVTADPFSSPVYPLGSFDVITDAVYVRCPDDHACSDLGRVGNRSKPYATVAGGIGAAYTLGLHEIRVASRGGGAAYRESLNLIDGVYLRGGYSPDFSIQDSLAYPTRIANDDMTLVNASEIGPAGAGVEGFTFLGGGATRQEAYGMQVANVCRFTLRDCVLAPRPANTKSVGLAILSSGVRDDDPASVHYCPEPELIIEGNRIDSGYAREWQYASSIAVQISDSDVTLRHNTIVGGDASTQLSNLGSYWAIGVKIVRGATVLEGNQIHCGDVILDPGTPNGGANVAEFAVTTDIYLGDHVLTNNLLVGGHAADGVAGLYLTPYGINGDTSPSGAAIVSNNTVVMDASLASGATGTECYGVRFGCGDRSHVSLTNNLVAATGLAVASDFHAFRKLHNADFPDSMENNVAAGFAYFYWNWGPNLTANQVDANYTQASNNREYGTMAEVFFSAPESGDYHLTASTPAAIALGGKDTSEETCGAGNSQSCGAVLTDLDGVVRTGAGAGSAYSVGAYERD